MFNLEWPNKNKTQPIMERQDIEQHIECALNWAQDQVGLDEIVQAKEEFFWKYGKVFPDDPNYDSRMSYFNLFFLLERPCFQAPCCQPNITTPYFIYDAYLSHALQRPSSNLYIKDRYHSIYQVKRVERSQMVIEDLWLKEERLLTSLGPGEFSAFQKHQLFQGFVFNIGESFFLSQGLIFHPYTAAKNIKKTLKIQKNNRENLAKTLAGLALASLKHQRHPHIDLNRFYLP